MADIFISFSTADAARVRQVYDAFVARGLSVFWSNDIPKGVPDYHAVIRDEIRKAPIVVVVWTHASITSHPVSQECSQAERDNKLIQVLIDDIEPIDFPMEVRFRAQKTFLIGWNGDPQHREWLGLNDALDKRLGRRAGAQSESRAPSLPRPAAVSEAEREWRAHDLDNCADPGLLKSYAAKWQTVDFVWAYKAQQKAAAEEAAEQRRQAEERERQTHEAETRKRAAEAQATRDREASIEQYRRDGRLPAEPGAGKTKWFQDIKQGPEMVVVPPGVFMMGEGSEQKVAINAPFAVGRFTVTFAEWDAAGLPHKPSDQGWGRGRRPVINVSWDDAKTYTVWLSQKTGKKYRLLSEAEWEYCCRAGSTTKYAFGDTISQQQAQFSAKSTVEVGKFPPNAWGLHDMHGNVWEWCEDRYDASSRVLRGGSWNYNPVYLRSANRSWTRPDFRFNFFGFRVARTL